MRVSQAKRPRFIEEDGKFIRRELEFEKLYSHLGFAKHVFGQIDVAKSSFSQKA